MPQITVNDILKKLQDGQMDTPDVLADYLIQCSASLYTASEIETDLEVGYCQKYEAIKNEREITDKLAEMKAKQTSEWRDWQRAKNTTKCLIEVIRSIKKKLAVVQQIYSEGQNYG